MTTRYLANIFIYFPRNNFKAPTSAAAESDMKLTAGYLTNASCESAAMVTC